MSKPFFLSAALVLALLSASGAQAQKPPLGQVNLGQNRDVLLNKGKAVQGRFRVTLTGFTCNRETWDDALERDGRRDEVFFLSRTVGLVQNGSQWRAASQSAPLRSVVYGDPTNKPGRISAGSSRPGVFGGEPGGIMTGDSYPSVPYQRQGEPTPTKLPILLWQGELSTEPTAPKMVIMPTIWEWDGPDDLLTTLLGRPLMNAPFLSLPDKVLGALAQGFGSGKVAGGAELSTLETIIQPMNAEWALGREVRVNKSFLGDAKDRPIGMVSTGESSYNYQPFGIILTYSSADWISKTDFGNGRGMITVRYKDDEALKGDYTLFIQVERQ